MTSIIKEIYISAASGAPMEALTSAELQASRGIVGDRYHAGEGQFSKKLLAGGADDWQLTLIESEQIDRFLKSEGLSLTYGDFRRNIVTANIDLNSLVQQRFYIDGVLVEGVRLCEPCSYLSGLLTDRLMPSMVGRCGLRARIISAGKIVVGGAISV
jgi:MOSC domain-containing protein YiiM